jgi:uncharacterized protein (DUF2062 family)
LGTSISLPPTIPPITWAGYEIGRFILKGKFEPLSWSVFKNITFHKIWIIYKPLFLGSVILGVICAVISYFLSLFFVKRFSLRKEHDRRI